MLDIFNIIQCSQSVSFNPVSLKMYYSLKPEVDLYLEDPSVQQ